MEDVAAEAGITRLIVYRHFDSKQGLYDAVLEQVSHRLREAVIERMRPGQLAPGAAEAMITVARSDPAAFTLLWRHASREPQFAEHARQIHTQVVNGAGDLLSAQTALAPELRGWAATTLVAFLIDAVLAWLDEGDPANDPRFVEVMGRSMPALVRTWSIQS